jgi:hypothetical protein
LLLDLALLALARWQRNINPIIRLTLLDVFIILTGLQAGSSLTGCGKGFRFIVSTAAMIVLLLPDLHAACP